MVEFAMKGTIVLADLIDEGVAKGDLDIIDLGLLSELWMAHETTAFPYAYFLRGINGDGETLTVNKGEFSEAQDLLQKSRAAICRVQKALVHSDEALRADADAVNDEQAQNELQALLFVSFRLSSAAYTLLFRAVKEERPQQRASKTPRKGPRARSR